MNEPPTTRPHGVRRAGLFLLAFGSGFAVLTIEIAGARLIAPVFGLSAVPWTAVIGVILGALALGSHLGGRMADRGRVPLSVVLLVAGLTAGIPLVGDGVPWFASNSFGFIGGAVVSALVLFAPAVLCLGAVVPYLVQADTWTLGDVGRRAGDVSAAATAGSIAGSFLTGFVLLPAFPLPVLLGLTAAGLLALAALSGWILGRTPPVELLGLAALGMGLLGVRAARLPADTLARGQTLYGSVRVTERDWGDGRLVRELWQNGSSSSAEYADTGEPAHIYVKASLRILDPVLERAQRVLVLGGAAMSLPTAFARRQPDASIDVVEIDPKITGFARGYFAYGRRDYPDIHLTYSDARVFLRRTDATWDLVYVDVFDNLLSVPWTMVTTEALTSMSRRLAPGGVLAINVLTPLEGEGTAFVQRFRATLEQVFPQVRAFVTDTVSAPTSIQNVILLAARDPDALPDLPWPAGAPPAAGAPLTDAWAPVEYLQARIFLEGVRWN